ncbi:UDP-2,3-diacylglucosamine diphosphatase [candidate division KSB1 bacterium]|nr:UDP-2,3-diacylglucosamine diphosphatase [candidate division KSB1 bacterium]
MPVTQRDVDPNHKPIFFISDAHLGLSSETDDKRREKQLLAFFDHVRVTGHQLYIVGDLFDFWFEYAHAIPRHSHRIIQTLKTMVSEDIEIHFIVGNHDFAIGDFFTDELGISVHYHPLEKRFSGKRFLIDHGDGIDPKDVGYRFIKKIFRHPISIALFRLLHPDFGFWIAHTLSNLSRDHRPIKDRDQIYIDYANVQFNNGFDYLIMGHTHRPQEYHSGDHTYINTGDWMTLFTYGVFDGNNLRLEYWDAEPK